MKTKLDVLFINPGSRSEIYQRLAKDLTAYEPPIWAGLMATFARQKGLSVDILDTEALALRSEETADRVAEASATLVVIVVYGHHPSASTQNMTSVREIVDAIKRNNPNTQILLAGGHVAALPVQTLNEEKADYVAVGEGLWTIIDLVQALNSSSASPDLTKVRGLGYRKDSKGTVQLNPGAPLVQNLDQEMPGVAWDLLPMDRYVAHNWHCFDGLNRKPYAAIYTTLGCPYHCSFCCIQAPFRDGEKLMGMNTSYRFWSPDAVIAQIDILVQKYGVKNIKIADEMFVLNMKHVEGICDRIIARGYDLNIWAYARIDTVREGMLPKLKKAGFNWLAFGIEAGSERVRQNVEKRFEQEEIFKTIQAVKDAGIHVIGNYIFGLPEDDLQSMKETLDLAIELNCEFANFYSTMAYPGSPIYDEALKQGLALPEKWSGYSQYSEDCMPLATKYLTSAEVLAFRDQAFHVYFENPRYQELIFKKFGTETLEHVKKMAQYRLKRNIVDEAKFALNA